MKIPFKQKFIYTILTVYAIFTADLTITILNKYIMTLNDRCNLYLVTLIGMAVVLILFYILVSNIQKLSDWSVRTFVKMGKRYMGRTIGLYISLIFLFFVIFTGYYWAWFDRSFPAEVWQYVRSLLPF